MKTLALASWLTLLSACSGGTPAPVQGPSASACAEEPTRLAVRESPGGVPEVSAEWVAAHPCDDVQVVDVRGADELTAGTIGGSLHMPLPELESRLDELDPARPVVFVCRSGRRSARAAQVAEKAGFSEVASMTGGMIRWVELGYQTRTPSSGEASASPAEPPAEQPHGVLDAEGLRAALMATHLPRLRVATLLSRGTEACVDGRDEHAVLGAPGGDAGELVAALAVAEDQLGRALTDAEVADLFAAHIEGFGRFYFHSDRGALEALRKRLSADRRFAGQLDDIEDLVRHPAPNLRGALLEHLLTVEATGCGHLGLMLKQPEAYKLRRELVRSVLRESYWGLWQRPETIDFVVLEGHHHEGAIVSYRSGRELHAYSTVPALPPHIAGHRVFVHHPEVSRFVQALHAAFFVERLAALRDAGTDADRFEAELTRMSDLHLEQTLKALAPDLPRFEVREVERGQWEVRAVQPAAPGRASLGG